MKLDEHLIAGMTPVFKELKLTNEAAQQLADAVMRIQADLPKRMLARDLEVTMKDKELGGLNYGRTVGFVNAALTAFTDAPFRQFLEKSGIANRLEFVRVFERIGRAVSSDAPSAGTPRSASSESVADRIYSRTQRVN